MARRNYDPKFTGNTAVANKMRPLPQFQQKKDNAPSQQKFVESLDEILRRNKGGFTAIGSETSSNIPWFVGNRTPQLNPTGIQQNNTQASAFTPNASSRTNAQLPELPQRPQNDQIDNINQFFDAIEEITQAQPQSLEYPMYDDAQPVGSHQSGGIMYSDGSVRYADGTIVDQGGQSIVPIRSNADGTVGYSDGSNRFVTSEASPIMSIDGNRVLYSDGTVRYGNYMYNQSQGQTPGGQSGLIRGIFGQDRTITQDYGNVNPIEPTPGNINYGTDIRTRDLQSDARQLKLPVGATVVDVKYDDGTRFGDQSGHQGYGNSLLLQLPSGEMLRFSHLDSILNVKPGQRIEPGQVFGTPGTTGNTYGEHLDLEYYDANGQIANPANFSGFTNPSTLIEGQNAPGTIADTSDLPSYLQTPQDYQKYMQSMSGQNQSQATSQPNAQNRQVPTPMTDAVRNVGQNIAQIPQEVGNTFANTVDRINPTGKFDLGATELARGDREAAGQKINETGQMLADKGIGAKLGNSPEGFIGAGEAVAGNLPAAGRELSATIERVNPTPRIDTGLSELLRGDVEGAKANFKDTTSRVASRLQQIPEQLGNVVAPPAYAAEPGGQSKIQTLGENIQGAANSAGDYLKEKAGEAKNLFSNAVAKPMEGVKKLKDEFGDVTDKINPFKFDPSKLSGDRKLGDESGFSTNELPGALATPDGEKNDIRDPFFKYGGSEKFAKFLNPDVASSGGLSLGLFNNDFYKNPNNIAEVFGATDFASGATDKYKDSIRSEYGQSFENEIRSKYPTERRPGETSYDANSVSNYIKQVRDSVNSYLGGLKPFTTEQATYQDFRPGSTNPVKPGQNYSPYVSVAQQVEKARKSAQSLGGNVLGNIQQGANGLKNLFSSISAPKGIKFEAPKVNTPQMSFANVSKPKTSHRPSLEEYLGIGKTAAQYYAEVGGQSVADAAGGADKAANAYFDAKSNAYRQNPSSSNSSQSPRQIQSNAVDDSIMAAGQGKAYYSNTGNRIYNYTPANANMTDAGTGLPVYGGSSGSSSSSSSNPGIFSKAAGVLKRLFNF